MTEQLRGTGVALVTPMTEGGALDTDGMRRLVDHVVSGGVDYLVLMGTTGESPTITWDEKMLLLDVVADQLAGRKPLVFGLGGNDTAALVDKAKKLAGKPIDALLSASPHYNKPSQEGIYRHYTALADASPFPVILYNVPHRTASNVTAETTLRLAQHPHIVAMKEASGDLLQCGLIARDKPDGFLLLSGDDLLTLPMMAIGAEGVISVAANAFPKAFSDMVNAALNHDPSAAKHHQALIRTFQLAIQEGNPSSIKAALEAQGICQRHVRLPLVAASDELVGMFRG